MGIRVHVEQTTGQSKLCTKPEIRIVKQKISRVRFGIPHFLLCTILHPHTLSYSSFQTTCKIFLCCMGYCCTACYHKTAVKTQDKCYFITDHLHTVAFSIQYTMRYKQPHSTQTMSEFFLNKIQNNQAQRKIICVNLIC